MEQSRLKRRNKEIKEIPTMVYGKVPPQAPELEKAVLGTLLLTADKIDIVRGILPSGECFYMDAHQRIYDAILRLHNISFPIDMLTITEELNKKNDLEMVGGAYYLAVLTSEVVTDAHLEAHAHIVMEKFLAREIIRIGGQMIGDAYENSTDVFDLLNQSQEAIMGVDLITSRTSYDHVSAATMETVNIIEETQASGNKFTGVPTGYDALDRMTYGWQPGDLVIIAARPSVGKTAFVLNLALNACKHRQKPTAVGFFSLEMSKVKLVQRCISALSHIPLDNIKRGKLTELEWKRISEASGTLSSLKLFLDETGGINIQEFRSKARRMVKKDNIGLIIIDYLQLMQGLDNGRNSNRENEVAKISRDLKSLAKELHIPIIALSQLNRNVETRKENKGEPFLADLRESGAIEQDADSIIFLWRPDYQSTSGDNTFAHDVNMKIAKNRDGQIERLLFKVDLAIQKFFDLDGWETYHGHIAFGIDEPF